MQIGANVPGITMGNIPEPIRLTAVLYEVLEILRKDAAVTPQGRRPGPTVSCASPSGSAGGVLLARAAASACSWSDPNDSDETIRLRDCLALRSGPSLMIELE